MDLLKELTETFGPSGHEDEVRNICHRELEPLCDSVEVDALGNLIARKSCGKEGAKTVMLAGHMDEIGFMVRFIDDNGYLRLNPVGGFDPKTLIAKRVLVRGKSGKKHMGLIGTKPVHIMKPDEAKKMPTLDDLFVDLGMPAEAVKEEIELGCPVTLWQTFAQWGDVATCKCMDNRVSLWVIIRALQRAESLGYHVAAVMTSQEEIGIRGATVAAQGINPDLGVAIDVTLACDVPGADKKDYITELGKGTAIKIMDAASVSHPGLVKAMRTLAEEKEIPHQMEILPKGGTDARGIQMAHEGKPVTTLSVPCRYVHSVVETINVKDLEATANLMAAFLEAAPAF